MLEESNDFPLASPPQCRPDLLPSCTILLQQCLLIFSLIVSGQITGDREKLIFILTLSVREVEGPTSVEGAFSQNPLLYLDLEAENVDVGIIISVHGHVHDTLSN